MKKKFFPVLLVFVSFVSCLPLNPKIVISNGTDVTYDSIKVYAVPEITTAFFDVAPGDVVRNRIQFDKNYTLADGAYTIEMFKSGEMIKNKSFGYYTNGATLNRKIRIKIKSDTLLIKLH